MVKNLITIFCLLFAFKSQAQISYVRIDTVTGAASVSVTVNTLSTQYAQLAITDFQAIARTTPFDNQGNTYVLDTTVNDGSVARVSLYHVYFTTQNAATVITYTTSATAYIRMAVHSLNGVATSNPIDKKGGFASAIATVLGTPSSITPSVSGCMIFTAANARGGGATSGFPTIAGGGGYTQTMWAPFISLTQFASGTAYLIQGAPAAAAQTWNYATSSSSAIAQVAIKPEPSAGGKGLLMWFSANR